MQGRLGKSLFDFCVVVPPARFADESSLRAKADSYATSSKVYKSDAKMKVLVVVRSSTFDRYSYEALLMVAFIPK